MPVGADSFQIRTLLLTNVHHSSGDAIQLNHTREDRRQTSLLYQLHSHTTYHLLSDTAKTATVMQKL